MKRIETIKKKKDFNNIIKNGKFLKNPYFVIYFINKEEEKPFFGIAISKKIGNAVERNKLKRITRCIIDNNRNLFKNYHNYIIMIRKECVKTKYINLAESFQKLLENQR